MKLTLLPSFLFCLVSGCFLFGSVSLDAQTLPTGKFASRSQQLGGSSDLRPFVFPIQRPLEPVYRGIPSSGTPSSGAIRSSRVVVAKPIVVGTPLNMTTRPMALPPRQVVTGNRVSVFPPAPSIASASNGLSRSVSDRGWYPYVLARGNDREKIKQTPIELRPNRPLHFYGNAVRRANRRNR